MVVFGFDFFVWPWIFVVVVMGFVWGLNCFDLVCFTNGFTNLKMNIDFIVVFFKSFWLEKAKSSAEPLQNYIFSRF